MWILFLIILISIVILIIYLNTKQKGDSGPPVILSSVSRSLEAYTYNIVGEQSYQNNLEKISGEKEEKSKKFECSAKVMSEPTNRYDANAVKVEINGLLVGYLSKDEAKKLKGKNINKIVPALINGGWYHDDSEGSYGVKLAINNIFDLL